MGHFLLLKHFFQLLFKSSASVPAHCSIASWECSASWRITLAAFIKSESTPTVKKKAIKYRTI